MGLNRTMEEDIKSLLACQPRSAAHLMHQLHLQKAAPTVTLGRASIFSQEFSSTCLTSDSQFEFGGISPVPLSNGSPNNHFHRAVESSEDRSLNPDGSWLALAPGGEEEPVTLTGNRSGGEG